MTALALATRQGRVISAPIKYKTVTCKPMSIVGLNQPSREARGSCHFSMALLLSILSLKMTIIIHIPPETWVRTP